ncbi:Acetyltransferase (GNAT) domain protein [uncultured archaeon]|nr:Acetyltransferase (GNAT) domain protein [uncultured archaeon]
MKKEEIFFRNARISDALAISKLIKRNLVGAKINKYTLEQVRGIAQKNTVKEIRERIKKFKVFCALEKGKLIGTVYFGEVYPKENNIGGLYIDPAFLYLGVGKKLLHLVEKYARKKKVRRIDLYALNYSKDFYLRNGYKINKVYMWKVGKAKTRTYGMEKNLK